MVSLQSWLQISHTPSICLYKQPVFTGNSWEILQNSSQENWHASTQWNGLLLTNAHFLTKWKIPCWSCTCGDADVSALCLNAVVPSTSRKWEEKTATQPQKSREKSKVKPSFITCQWHCGQPARQGDKSHFCLSFMLTSDEQNNIQGVRSHLYLSGVPLQLVIRSLDPAASEGQQIFLTSLFVFKILNCLQFSLFFLLVPLIKGYLPLTLGNMHALTPKNKFYAKRTYWERISVVIHSPSYTQLLHAWLSSVHFPRLLPDSALIWKLSSWTMQSTTPKSK